MVVSRASQVHQMPHTGRAQIGPVMRTMLQNITPTSAEAAANASLAVLRFHRYTMEARKLTKKQTPAVHAEGT